MESSSITILGGDLRQCYAAEYLCAQGWQVLCWHTPRFPYSSKIRQADCLSQALEHCDLLLAPTPLTQDGINLSQSEDSHPACRLQDIWEQLSPCHALAAFGIPKEHQEPLEKTGCRTLIFGASFAFNIENALLTAEGLLSEVIRCTPFALSCANVLLLGFGCCGSAIGKLFHPLCRTIYLVEEDEAKQRLAENNGICPIRPEDFSQVLPQCQIVINTIPGAVLEPSLLPLLHSSCHLFDIASAPYGFPPDTTRNCLLPYFRIPGIPGRFSPVTAGEIIGRTIERMTEHAL